MSAYDSANPSQRIFTELVFPISRNEHGPVFEREIYQAEISENYPPGDSILQVRLESSLPIISDWNTSVNLVFKQNNTDNDRSDL